MGLSDFQIRLSKLNDEELIDAFNKDVGNPGWVRARGEFHYAIVEEFKRRNIDYSMIKKEAGISWANRIKLTGSTISFEE